MRRKQASAASAVLLRLATWFHHRNFDARLALDSQAVELAVDLLPLLEILTLLPALQVLQLAGSKLRHDQARIVGKDWPGRQKQGYHRGGTRPAFRPSQHLPAESRRCVQVMALP
jgi:hypothetical protein